jgi:ABC-type methionine transport system ATPase subunit
VAIARALANRPRLLLMDEPTGELDSVTGGAMMDLVEGLNREEGVTVLVVTHDRAVARRCTRIIALRDGRIEADHGVSDPLLEDALEFSGSGLGRLLREQGAAEDPRLSSLGVPEALGAWLRDLTRRGGG